MFTNEEARAKLQAAVDQNREGAERAVQQVFEQAPVDQLVRSTAMRFETMDDEQKRLVLLVDSPELHVVHGLHKNALSQASERFGVPGKYASDLMAGAPWERQLLAHNLNTRMEHAGGRYLLRSVAGETRAILSDRFRRLDARPVVEALVQEAQALGAVAYRGHVTDLQVALQVVQPQVMQVVEGGEWVALGVSLSTSDFGQGTYALEEFYLRLRCINGMTAESLLRQVHLGRRLEENIEWSSKTYQLDTRAVVSGTRDVVRSVLAPAGRERMLDRLRASAEKRMEWPELERQLQRALTKDEMRAAKEAFTGPDVENLPAGDTVWRASNALSWIAKSATETARALDLERMAGQLIAAGNATAN